MISISGAPNRRVLPSATRSKQLTPRAGAVAMGPVPKAVVKPNFHGRGDCMETGFRAE